MDNEKILGVRRRVMAFEVLRRYPDRLVLLLACGHYKIAHVLQFKPGVQHVKIGLKMVGLKIPVSLVCYRCLDKTT